MLSITHRTLKGSGALGRTRRSGACARSFLPAERGQNLVGFSAAMMVVLVLLSGVLDLGRLYTSLLSLRDAAQEGASYASIAPTSLHEIQERVRQTSSDPIDFAAFADSQIEVQVTGPACSGNCVTVRLRYDFHFIAPFIHGITIPLSAEATDTILTPPC